MAGHIVQETVVSSVVYACPRVGRCPGKITSNESSLAAQFASSTQHSAKAGFFSYTCKPTLGVMTRQSSLCQPGGEKPQPTCLTATPTSMLGTDPKMPNCGCKEVGSFHGRDDLVLKAQSLCLSQRDLDETLRSMSP